MLIFLQRNQVYPFTPPRVHAQPAHGRHLPPPGALAGRTWTDVLTGAAVEADAALDVQAFPTELGAVLTTER
ncbi:hypothetical protein [Salinibacter ruber]|uniref:hypothetical protein n=1 Tax=Salinibacter ruber TaxID=146919 RepID=UPI002167CB19|nr:hypothetical protein [Salinibacter ruber]MCS3702339.1 hypothetical protein [Salinibacter ruber]